MDKAKHGGKKDGQGAVGNVRAGDGHLNVDVCERLPSLGCGAVSERGLGPGRAHLTA